MRGGFISIFYFHKTQLNKNLVAFLMYLCYNNAIQEKAGIFYGLFRLSQGPPGVFILSPEHHEPICKNGLRILPGPADVPALHGDDQNGSAL